MLRIVCPHLAGTVFPRGKAKFNKTWGVFFGAYGCTGTWIHIEIMPPDTIHGVGVITKPYFIIYAACKVLVTWISLRGQSSMLHFGGNQKPVYDFTQAVNSNFHSVFNHFRDIASFVRPEPIFSYPIPIPAKLWGSPWTLNTEQWIYWNTLAANAE